MNTENITVKSYKVRQPNEVITPLVGGENLHVLVDELSKICSFILDLQMANRGDKDFVEKCTALRESIADFKYDTLQSRTTPFRESSKEFLSKIKDQETVEVIMSFTNPTIENLQEEDLP